MVSKFLNNLNSRVKKHFNPNTYPDNSWYRCHLERNYDYVVLGDGRLCLQDYAVHNKKFFDWQLKGQTLLWDFKVLKQYFSILKPNGMVFFPVDEKSIRFGNCKVDDVRPYYSVISTYALSNNRWKIIMIKIQKKIPLLMFRFRDIVRNGNNCQKEARTEDIVPLLNDIKAFCDERILRPVFVSIDNKPVELLEKMGFIVVNRKDMNEYIKEKSI